MKYVWRGAKRHPSLQSGQEIVILHGVEVVSGIGATAKRLAILELLNIAQPSSNTTIAIGVVSVEGHADPTVAATIHLVVIQDGPHLGIDYLGSLSAIGIQEVAVLIVGVIGAVNVTVTEGEFKVGGDFASPLGHALLFCLLDSSLDCFHGLVSLLEITALTLYFGSELLMATGSQQCR